jgi:DNA-binding transcriptional LysR family regulator
LRMLVSRHLGNFLALYEARNMHIAAERKAISQPALTKSLKVLEQEVGTDLFNRTAKGLEPTEAGAALYRYACAIDQEARFAALDVGSITDERRGTLRIGVGLGPSASIFSNVLVALTRAFPAVDLIMETDISSRLVESLVHNRLDLVISARPPQALPERFVAVPLLSRPMVVITRLGHPLQTGDISGMEQLSRFRRVSFVEDREFNLNAKVAFGSYAELMQPTVQTDSLSLMLALLAETDYYAIVTDLIVPKAQREGLVVLPLQGSLWSIHFDLMCKASFLDSRPARTLRSAVLAEVAVHPAGGATIALSVESDDTTHMAGG